MAQRDRNDRRMFVAVAAATLGALALARAYAADEVANASALAEQLVGGWSLVSRVTIGPDGNSLVDPGLAATPKGILIYDRYGHVAAQLSRQGRTVEMLAAECREAENVRGTNDTAQTILGYDAYFGTYTVNAQEGVVTHHLVSALFPGDVGKDIKREFRISGDTLTIKFHTTARDGTSVARTLVWKRLK